MERKIISQLKAWKESPLRKPLILAGARQVGKTYILKEFAKREYEYTAYVNCDDNAEMANVFAEDYDIPRILRIIGAIRFSMSPYREQDWMRNIPLYAAGECFS